MRHAPHIEPAMPLLRLLGINCAAGTAVALIAVGGLLLLNGQLRALIFSDHSPAVPLVLLAGGFIVTFERRDGHRDHAARQRVALISWPRLRPALPPPRWPPAG